MAKVNIGQARRLAVRRVQTCLRAQLSTEITAAIAASDNTTLYNPAPLDQAIYANDPRQVEEVVRNHDVVCFVWPNGPRRIVTSASGGMNTYKAISKQEVSVVLLFKFALQPNEQTDAQSITLTQEVEMRLRAELYTEAIINTVLKYACQDSEVHDVVLTADDADAFPIYADEAPILLGLSQATFELTQNLTVPARRPLP